MPADLLARMRRDAPMGEPEIAAASVVLALTATVGCMVTVLDLVQGQLPLVALPTVGLLVSVARHEIVAGSWWSMAAWAALLPLALNMGIVAPLLMMVVCLGLAIGPDRVTEWAIERMKVTPPPAERGPEPEAIGWIEEDPRFS